MILNTKEHATTNYKKKENEIIYGQEKVNLLKNGNILDIVFLVVMLYTSAIQNSLL